MGKSNFSSIETISCFAYDAYFINEPQIKDQSNIFNLDQGTVIMLYKKIFFKNIVNNI